MAGHASRLTDRAAGPWIADAFGLERLDHEYAVELVDWPLRAMQVGAEGILMALARAVSLLLDRYRSRRDDIALSEIHEALAAQVLARIKGATDQDCPHTHTGVETD